MSGDSSKFDEKKGWQIGATLQRFKTFSFENSYRANDFLLKLIEFPTPREVHMQVTPHLGDLNVEVMLAYEPVMESEIRIILAKIDEFYQEFIS